MQDRVAREQVERPDRRSDVRTTRRPAGQQETAPAGVPATVDAQRASDAVIGGATSSSRIQRTKAITPRVEPAAGPRIRRSSANVIQRRVPLWSEIEADMNGPDRVELERGLAAAVKRTKKDLTPQQKSTAKKRMWMLKHHPNYQHESDAVLWTRVLNGLSTRDGERKVTYEGGPKRFVTPTGPEAQKLQTQVGRAVHALTVVGTSEKAVGPWKDVFGEDPEYGWAKARARCADAANWLTQLAEQDMIGANLSGEPEEMGYQGKTTFHKEIHLNRAAFLELKDPEAWTESFIALVHESFHAGHQDVTDHGGYQADAASFATRSEKVKYTNAAHYDEVFRRVFKIGPLGGVFVPRTSGTGGASDADVVGIGRTAAMDQLRRTHQIAVSAHKWLLAAQERQRETKPDDATSTTRLLKVSRAAGLTLHTRQRKPTDPLPRVTNLDLALIEGVAKRLNSRQVWVIRSAPKSIADWRDLPADDLQSAETVTGRILRCALAQTKPITGALDTDIELIKVFNEIHGEFRKEG
jgi:hypothetical protein